MAYAFKQEAEPCLSVRCDRELHVGVSALCRSLTRLQDSCLDEAAGQGWSVLSKPSCILIDFHV